MTVSSIPSIPTLKLHAGEYTMRLDYMIHFLEYASLAFLAYITFSGENTGISFGRYLIVTLALVLFAVIDEFHQKWIPGRSFNPADIISNISGIIATLVLIILLFRRRKQPSG